MNYSILSWVLQNIMVCKLRIISTIHNKTNISDMPFYACLSWLEMCWLISPMWLLMLRRVFIDRLHENLMA